MPLVRQLDLAYRALPPALDGLRIAQISDVHVGYFVSPAQLRRTMEKLAAEKPDLLVVTGDLIDDRHKIDETIEVLELVRPRLGAFACLGNHEHYTGLGAVRSGFARSSVRLLVNEAVRVPVQDGISLEVSAVDYPVGRIGMTDSSAYEPLAEQALCGRAPGGDFRLHLSHHPHGWDAARARGADLTLSGHTHGGQIVAFGQPIFSPFFRYIRGLYQHGEQKLFVHSGTGHWLPLRIGCPAEIAICTLRKGGVVAP
jgi:predicted MPP superfamily phosphohydrolase